MQGINRLESLFVLTVIASLLALAACGGKPATTTATQTTTSPPVTTTGVPPATTTVPPTSATTTTPATTTTTPPTSTTTVPPTTTSTTTAPPSTSKTRGPNEVWAQGYNFTPQVLTVSVGTTVIWTNFDTEDHTVTSDTNLFNGVLVIKGSWEFLFTQPGTYRYYCVPHPAMLGTIVVK